MAADIEPVELARLVDFAERPRQDDWSLRSAMVRYAQAEPVRAGRILEAVRRADGALHVHARLLRTHGPDVWDAFTSDREGDHDDVTQLLGVAAELDRLGDALASWAATWPGRRPNQQVDAVTSDVEARLERLGVPREEPPPGRGRERGRPRRDASGT